VTGSGPLFVNETDRTSSCCRPLTVYDFSADRAKICFRFVALTHRRQNYTFGNNKKNTMSRDIRESDWKHFRKVHRTALEMHCEVTLARLAEIASDGSRDAHERYLETYDYIHRRNKEVARTFDDFRRSTAVSHIVLLSRMDLISDDDLSLFSEDVLSVVARCKEE